MIEHYRRPLVICPHTDDEWACAGTMIRMAEAGAMVTLAALSRCDESLPDGYPPGTLETECRACGEAIGAASVTVLDYHVRRFHKHRQAILDDLLRLRDLHFPDLVLIPCSTDTHQDHAVVYQEAFRAFKKTTVLGYIMPWNVRDYHAGAFFHLADWHVDKKVAAISAYRSQQHRPYMSADAIHSVAVAGGLACGARYAECFEAIRLVFP